MQDFFTFWLTLMVSLIAPYAMAQFPIDAKTGKVKYTEVIDIPNQPKQVAYKKARSWMLTNLRSSDKMVMLDDPDFEQLVGAGAMYIDTLMPADVSPLMNGTVRFKLIVDFKEGKMRYSLENTLFTVSYTGTSTKVYEMTLSNFDPPFAFSKKGQENFNELNPPIIHRKLSNLLDDFVDFVTSDETEW